MKTKKSNTIKRRSIHAKPRPKLRESDGWCQSSPWKRSGKATASVRAAHGKGQGKQWLVSEQPMEKASKKA
ncbi:hypothetical protein [Hallella sp.]|uniref:hypothetical protein n=1 Tax=Hallella sp. TaxID=2980186 RepID=UPI00307A54C8